jgi:hypothetical protein
MKGAGASALFRYHALTDTRRGKCVPLSRAGIHIPLMSPSYKTGRDQ